MILDLSLGSTLFIASCRTLFTAAETLTIIGLFICLGLTGVLKSVINRRLGELSVNASNL